MSCWLAHQIVGDFSRVARARLYFCPSFAAKKGGQACVSHCMLQGGNIAGWFLAWLTEGGDTVDDHATPPHLPPGRGSDDVQQRRRRWRRWGTSRHVCAGPGSDSFLRRDRQTDGETDRRMMIVMQTSLLLSVPKVRSLALACLLAYGLYPSYLPVASCPWTVMGRLGSLDLHYLPVCLAPLFFSRLFLF
ncbi:hypothetical protein GGR56DRAFT_68234 [Xylariaceae sp. FL0804]|nr:hypothetical protein GGR56DRAFT_68234 [Xylariaceae sp. FL0804]